MVRDQPIISQTVVHGETVNLLGVGPDPVGDLRQQIKQVLARVDRMLEQAGTDKSRVLSALVWLADMDLRAEVDAAWNEWIGSENPPTLACLTAQLSEPGLLLEMMVTASRAPTPAAAMTWSR